MNLLVGDDEVTADKDYKHIFKHFRSLVLREKGIMIYSFKITPEITKHHLLMSGHRAETVNAWMKPKDAQDVPMTLSLLCALWELPDLPDGTSRTHPLMHDARTALKCFGRLLYYLVMCYERFGPARCGREILRIYELMKLRISDIETNRNQ